MDSYLWDVNLWALRTSHHHGLEVVVLRQRLLGWGSRFVTSVVEDTIHLVLKGLPQCVTRGRLQLVVVGFLNDLADKRENLTFLDSISAKKNQKKKTRLSYSGSFIIQILYAYFYHILFGFLDGILDVKVGLGISNGVTNTNGMTYRIYWVNV